MTPAENLLEEMERRFKLGEKAMDPRLLSQFDMRDVRYF